MPKILLVEDDEMNWDMLSRRLERRGFKVLIAADGLTGIELAKAELPDIILMDIWLKDGGIDGLEATRRLKGAADTQGIPIIALTAHAMNSDREKAIAAGCDDYDSKPVEFTRLIEKIQAQLSARGPTPSVAP